MNSPRADDVAPMTENASRIKRNVGILSVSIFHMVSPLLGTAIGRYRTRAGGQQRYTFIFCTGANATGGAKGRAHGVDTCPSRSVLGFGSL